MLPELLSLSYPTPTFLTAMVAKVFAKLAETALCMLRIRVVLLSGYTTQFGAYLVVESTELIPIGR